MKKWLLSVVGLTLVVGVSAIAVAFAVTGNGNETPQQESVGVTEPDPRGDKSTFGPLPMPTDDNLDPNAGIAIVRDDGTGKPAVVILPSGDTPACDQEPCEVGSQPPVTIIDDLDPNECSLVHPGGPQPAVWGERQ